MNLKALHLNISKYNFTAGNTYIFKIFTCKTEILTSDQITQNVKHDLQKILA